MKVYGTNSGTSEEGGDPVIKDLRKSVRRLRILTASLFALTIVLNLTPAAAEIKAKITGEDVVDGSLTGADIQDRSLTGVDVASSSIDGFNIALDTLVGGHVVDDSLTTLDVQDGSLTGADIQDGTLTGVDVQDGSLTGADVAPSSLNGSDILDNSLTGSDIDESTLANNFSLVGVSASGGFAQLRGADVVSVEKSPDIPGSYMITFDHHVAGCARNVHVSAGFSPGFSVHFTPVESPDVIQVQTYFSDGVVDDMNFELTVWC
jgi:hypothetical protein